MLKSLLISRIRWSITRTAVGWWGGSDILTGTPLSQLQFLQFVFQVGNVSSAVADVGIDTCLDSRVAGRLSHVRGGIDKGLFTLDLAVDLGDGLVGVCHGRGRTTREGSREEERSWSYARWECGVDGKCNVMGRIGKRSVGSGGAFVDEEDESEHSIDSDGEKVDEG